MWIYLIKCLIKRFIVLIHSYNKTMMSIEVVNSLLACIICGITVSPVILHTVSLPGDVKLHAVLAINERSKDGTCSSRVDVTSVMNLEAILWYIENLNAHGGLPFKVGKKTAYFNSLHLILSTHFKVYL